MDRDVPIDEVEKPQYDSSILPVFRQYRQENESWSPNLGLWSYIGMRADPDLAAAFTGLFWPAFVEVEGCVLLKHSYSPESFRRWADRYNGDTSAIEAVVNHVHIWDLFPGSNGEGTYSEELFEYLAMALMFGWKQALQAAYPDKRFVFTLRHGYGPEISFHQAG